MPFDLHLRLRIQAIVGAALAVEFGCPSCCGDNGIKSQVLTELFNCDKEVANFFGTQK